MSRVEAAALDRLPWLPDEPRTSRAEPVGNTLLPWAAAAAVVAGGSFWMGTRSVEEEPVTQARSTTTVRLPEARAPLIPPTRVEQDAIPPASVVGEQPNLIRGIHDRAAKSAPTAASRRQAVARRARSHGTPSRAAGRVVHVGAFGSSRQAKSGWIAIVRANPAIRNLPVSVIPARNSKGRSYYRFEIGTMSQAHSEVLCQRMRKAGLSCAIPGISRKAKDER
jgi:hypothetical protein